MPRRLSFDEAHHRRGRELATVVSDLDRRSVVDVIDGCTRRSIERYLRTLTESQRRAVEVVSIDPSEAYRQAIRSQLPAARIVCDHFHLVRGANTALDSTRRERQRRYRLAWARTYLKGMGLLDYEHAVLWNAMAPELWRRTAIQIPRELARLAGISQRQLRRRVRVSYVKVAEYQRRGALHFHALIRLDAVSEANGAREHEPPPGEFTFELLVQAVHAAVDHASVSSPVPTDQDARTGAVGAPARELRWGLQSEVRAIQHGGQSGKAALATAAYIAKYATKSTEVVGGLMHRVESGDLPNLKVRPHVQRLVESAWRLGGEQHLVGLRLRRWAHALGFRGHCFTKSRRYSTTFTRLRQARHQHVLRRVHRGEPRDPWGRRVSEGASREHRRWSFTGRGYRTLGDAWLAESAAARARERRRVARDELRTAQPAAALGRHIQYDGRQL